MKGEQFAIVAIRLAEKGKAGRTPDGIGPSSTGFCSNMIKPVTTNLRNHRTETFVATVLVAIVSLGALQVEARSNADRAFLAWAVQIEIQQQDMGRIAERRVQNDKVRDFGDYLLQRHQQAQRLLENVDNQVGEALSNKLSATHLRVQSNVNMNNRVEDKGSSQTLPVLG